MNDSMERPNDSDANTATTNEEEQTRMEIEKKEAEREKKNDDGVQYDTRCDKTKERNSASSEIETKNLNTTNDSVEGTTDSDANTATTGEKKKLTLDERFDRMENMMEQLKLLMQHHGCEETEGRKRVNKQNRFSKTQQIQ